MSERVTDFQLSDTDREKVQKWWKQEHSKTCDLAKPGAYHGAIGGVLTYCFTHTSVGLSTSVECACGEKYDFTDYDVW